MMKPPLISFIIATFNSGHSLVSTLESILSQTYPRFEIIVIDGGSSDETVNILKSYGDKITYWVSEVDRGIAHAFNKGIQVANGDYINFQGSGDTLTGNEVLSEIFTNQDFLKDFVIARINRVTNTSEKKVLWASKRNKPKFNYNTLVWRMSLYHQALFTHKSYFQQYGEFDENLKYSMDYEHILRSFKNKPSIYTSNIIFSNWRQDGLGENNELKIFSEYNLIKQRHRIKPWGVLFFVNYFILLKFFLKKILSSK
ncbi:glycosyltransferase family 2 protein [Aquirufa sp. A-Brett2-W8]